MKNAFIFQRGGLQRAEPVLTQSAGEVQDLHRIQEPGVLQHVRLHGRLHVVSPGDGHPGTHICRDGPVPRI